MLANIGKVLLSNFILTIVGLINSFIFPVLMSVDDYALYQQFLLYVSYINICHLGIASGMFLNYAGKKYSSIEKRAYKSEILLIYIVLSIFSIMGVLLGIFSKSFIIICVAFTIFSDCLIASYRALYQAWERFTGYSIMYALPKLMITVLGLISYYAFHVISGKLFITIYMIVSWLIAVYLIIEFFSFTKGEKRLPFFSQRNKTTVWSGFLITLGNYVSLLFHSIDKQFVNVVYSTFSFAQYSFAMSTQTIMTIFITALANPFYPRLAKGDIDQKYIQKLKSILFIFGAYSGCAYFGVSFCVKHWVVKYIPSLEVVSIFFAVFPAMAVINVIYINLYKIQKKLKKYIFTLVGMLILAIILNMISVLLHGDYIGISIATLIAYYLWLIYSQRDFEEINLLFIDYLYLTGFFLIYFLSKLISNDIIGFFSYGVLITCWNIFIYRSLLLELILKIFTTFRKRFVKKYE